MRKVRRQNSTDFSGAPAAVRPVHPQLPPHRGPSSRRQEAGGGCAESRATFHRRPAHRRPGANFPRPALGAAGGPQGACRRQRSRVRVDWLAERAGALGPLAAPQRSPALRYLGSEDHGHPAERARGRSPETWALLGAQRSPDTRALHLARLVGAPTLPVPPAIPSRAGRGGRGGEAGGGAAVRGPPPLSGPAPNNRPTSPRRRAPWPPKGRPTTTRQAAVRPKPCAQVASGWVGGPHRHPHLHTPPCPSRCPRLPGAEGWEPKASLRTDPLSMPFRRMHRVEHREEKTTLGTRSPTPMSSCRVGEAPGCFGPVVSSTWLSRVAKKSGGCGVGVRGVALTPLTQVTIF